MPNSCPKGKIRKSSYIRRAYSKKNGSKVKKSKVKSTCVKDMGKKGKTPSRAKILPKPDNNLHLTKYGYKVHNTELSRHRALSRAVKVFGSTKTIKHLNLIRNYTAVPENKKIMSNDIEYLKKMK